MGCATVKPVDVYCPRPVRPVLTETLDDKGLLSNYNIVVDYSLKLESVIECHEVKK
ncbi:MAG: hypothetical protein WC373_10860 [Smithella sp.]|jgi:hypothetical protein